MQIILRIIETKRRSLNETGIVGTKRRSLIETGNQSREDVMLVAQPNTFYVTVVGEMNFTKVIEISNAQRLLTRDMKNVPKVLT